MGSNSRQDFLNVIHKYEHEHKRTGRTSRMIESASGAVMDGNAITVVAHTTGYASELKGRICRAVADAGYVGNVLITATIPGSPALRGVPDEAVFEDHRVPYFAAMGAMGPP